MAKNCEKIQNLPVIMGDPNRERKTVTLDQCSGKAENVITYGMEKGDKFTFPKLEDVAITELQVRAGQKGVMYLVAGKRTRNGQTYDDYFNVNSLHQRDVNNQPLHPEWYALGDIKKRVEKLCEVGAVECKDVRKYNAAVWDRTTNKRVTITNDEGKTIAAYEEREAPIITVCA